MMTFSNSISRMVGSAHAVNSRASATCDVTSVANERLAMTAPRHARAVAAATGRNRLITLIHTVSCASTATLNLSEGLLEHSQFSGVRR